MCTIQINADDKAKKIKEIKEDLLKDNWRLTGNGYDTKNKQVILIFRKKFNTCESWKEYKKNKSALKTATEKRG